MELIVKHLICICTVIILMNIKNDKGMTLVVLAITVILLVILAYVTIDIGINMGESAKFESIKTNIHDCHQLFIF